MPQNTLPLRTTTNRVPITILLSDAPRQCRVSDYNILTSDKVGMRFSKQHQ
ncbi:MAG: hypothetical protein ACN4GM_12135 [Gammaproteobacteria bacterium]